MGLTLRVACLIALRIVRQNIKVVAFTIKVVPPKTHQGFAPITLRMVIGYGVVFVGLGRLAFRSCVAETK